MMKCYTQRQLTVGDVDPGGATVTVGDEDVSAPAGAEPFLRAARFQRLADGAGPTELLLVRNGKAIGYRALLDAVGDAAAECGVLLSRDLLTRQKMDERHWRQRQGVSVQSLVPLK